MLSEEDGSATRLSSPKSDKNYPIAFHPSGKAAGYLSGYNKKMNTFTKLRYKIASMFKWRTLRKKLRFKNIVRFSWKATLFIIVLVAILFIWYSKDLPKKGKIEHRFTPESTVILDRNGKTLYDVYGQEKRTSISYTDMSQNIKNATVAVEDKNFYKHHGFDFAGLFRAVFYRLTGRGSTAGGGSTITQQFVKNALLSPKYSISRKIQELILSIEIEQMYSKDEILQFYLNEIPYGNSNYGIEAASQYYFNKPAKDLSIAESALLAGIPQRPTYYSPYGTHTDALIARRNHILSRMLELGYIKQDEHDNAKKDDTLAKIQPKHQQITAPHFVMYVKEQLENEYGQSLVESGGLKVYTSLDLEKQQAAEKALSDNADKIKKYNGDNGAITSVDPKTGEILAMVGSLDYFDQEHQGNFNAAIGSRQPGSSFKPIVYAAAFKGKYNPGYNLFDLKTDFGNYSPDNFDGNTHGPVTMRTALANSLNIPAVKTLGLVGIDKALETAKDLGITTLKNDPNHPYGLALVLGGGEVKPLEMASAFSTFANQGKHNDLISILKIEDKDGKVLKENKPQTKDALDPQSAYEINSVLSDNDARSLVFGTRSPLAFSDRTVAAKTGTTQNFMDAWTVGYTPSLATSVWVGRNDNKPMANMADGVIVAAPIFHQYMVEALKNTPNEEFTRPDGIQELTVERYSNKLPTDFSREFVKDIFTSWQVPKDHDDINVTVKICKFSNKLATDLTPPDQIEEKTYTAIHSEMPDNSNWEGPVRAWAEAAGMGDSPPKEKCTEYNSDNEPKVKISKPASGASLSGQTEISVDINSSYNVTLVQFFVDNVSIGDKTSAPYSINYDFSKLSAGEHKISVTATNELGLTGQDSVTATSSQDKTAPGDVLSVTLTKSGNGKVSLQWTNPTDADLSNVNIYQSQIPSGLGSLAKKVTAVPSGAGSTEIASLSAGTYYFTFRPLDSLGNENTSTKQYKIDLSSF